MPGNTPKRINVSRDLCQAANQAAAEGAAQPQRTVTSAPMTCTWHTSRRVSDLTNLLANESKRGRANHDVESLIGPLHPLSHVAAPATLRWTTWRERSESVSLCSSTCSQPRRRENTRLASCMAYLVHQAWANKENHDANEKIVFKKRASSPAKAAFVSSVVCCLTRPISFVFSPESANESRNLDT